MPLEVDGQRQLTDHPGVAVDDDLRADPDADIAEFDPRESERIRRRDREAGAQERDLLKPGMGKVFKQIQDAQRKAAAEVVSSSPRSRRRGRA